MITDLCVFDVERTRFNSRSPNYTPGVSVADVRAKTGCDFKVAV
jgi:3-oxoacid CoA-transferase